jgi:single-strand DNA-binding protein
MRTIVQGRLKSRQYETREGEKRTVFEIDVDEVGPSLRSATAKVAKTTRSGAGSGGWQGQGGGGGGNDPWANPPAGGNQPSSGGAAGNDPWASGGGGGGTASEEPPF